MARVKFDQKLIFGDSSPLKLNKAHQYNQEWERLSFEQFLKIKMEDIFGGLRLVAECKVLNKVCRVTTHQQDYDAIRQKYPDDLVVDLRQIFMLWKHVPDFNEELPRVLIACGKLDATVV